MIDHPSLIPKQTPLSFLKDMFLLSNYLVNRGPKVFVYYLL